MDRKDMTELEAWWVGGPVEAYLEGYEDSSFGTANRRYTYNAAYLELPTALLNAKVTHFNVEGINPHLCKIHIWVGTQKTPDISFNNAERFLSFWLLPKWKRRQAKAA